MRKRNTYSRIIQNVTGWGEDHENFEKGKMINLLYHCIENDITSFDTADFSGNPVGRTFGTALSESGFGRDNIQIISKYRSSLSNKDLTSTVDDLLLTLRTDYLDLILLEYSTQPEELFEHIERLSSQGKIIEVGGLDLQESEIASFEKLFPIRANQTKMDFFSPEGRDLKRFGTTSEEIIKMVLCEFSDFAKTPDKKGLFEELSSKYQVDTTGLFLSWLLSHPSHLHPVISFTATDMISEAAAEKEVNMSPVDWQKINVLLS